MPNRKGYSTSSINTNYFEGACPDFNVDDDYIDLDFLIRDKAVFEKSELIFLSMVKVTSENHRSLVYNEYYKPQYGYNHIRIKNRNDAGKFTFSFGLIFKQELKKEFPGVSGFRCYFNK